MLRRITPILLLAALTLAGTPARAHDVKDPVCRMIVDSDTTKWKHRLGSKTFYFCARACQDRFAARPEQYEKLAALLEKQDLHAYRVDLATSPDPVAGRPVDLTFAVRYAEDEKLVREFEEIHERLFHLIMVSEDLSWFEHQHPVRGDDGLFRKTWTFPRPGRYTLYADFTPADGDNQVKALPLVVGGGPEKSYPLRPDRKLVKQVGDYRVELSVRPGTLRMEQPAVLTYTIRDRRGRPLRNMQPFIGAMGHLLAISENRKEVVHTHALHPTAVDRMDHGEVRVTAAMATEKGPAFSFKLTTPTAGLYKTWAQFLHNNRVLTVPFVFQVRDIWDTASRPAAGSRKQVSCPVMKGPIAETSGAPSLRVNNVPVYFCCAGCDVELKKTPAKYLAGAVKDPVTGKPFRVTASTPKAEHQGALYLFSGAESREIFRKNPARYAGRASGK